ncbi:MAG: hypothetical protein MJ100_01175 [Ruminococcus sp.]|nr:hypothetical protein [Ruminococcus sp.]
MKRKKIIIISVLVIIISYVLTMTLIFSLRKAVISLILTFAGMILPLLLIFNILYRLKREINIYRHGTKIIGRCTKYIRSQRNRYNLHVVEFEDESGNTIEWYYAALHIHYSYPHDIAVYMLDNSEEKSNLGMLTIGRYLIFLAFSFAVWIICSIGVVHFISEIIKYT